MYYFVNWQVKASVLGVTTCEVAASSKNFVSIISKQPSTKSINI